MIGYCYLDVEGRLNYKTQAYIETENPRFWQDNEPFLLKVWRFDSGDQDSMRRMYTGFKQLKLKSGDVIDFSKSIGFDINTLKNNASSV